MSVRQSLLAILDQGPCYGYQLRTEYERRTGAGVLNVGQIYTTLERLERDGMVARGDADERGHVYWAITAAGRDTCAAWFAAPDERGARDDLVHKIALAATLPGVDVAAAIGAQHRAADQRLRALEGSASVGSAAHELIVREAALAHARADLQWLQAASALAGDAVSRPFALSADRPSRGRPARSPETGESAQTGPSRAEAS